MTTSSHHARTITQADLISAASALAGGDGALLASLCHERCQWWVSAAGLEPDERVPARRAIGIVQQHLAALTAPHCRAVIFAADARAIFEIRAWSAARGHETSVTAVADLTAQIISAIRIYLDPDAAP